MYNLKSMVLLANYIFDTICSLNSFCAFLCLKIIIESTAIPTFYNLKKKTFNILALYPFLLIYANPSNL